VKTRKGYLAGILLATTVVAGYLGMLPLLQSLAADPVWPKRVAAIAATQTVTAGARTAVVTSRSSPVRVVVPKRHRIRKAPVVAASGSSLADVRTAIGSSSASSGSSSSGGSAPAPAAPARTAPAPTLPSISGSSLAGDTGGGDASAGGGCQGTLCP
jgi:hypothetical protein